MSDFGNVREFTGKKELDNVVTNRDSLIAKSDFMYNP